MTRRDVRSLNARPCRATHTFMAALTLGLISAQVARADYIDHFAARDDIGLLKVPHEGRVQVLVVPVIIEDLPFLQGDEGAFLDEIDGFFDPDAAGWAFTAYWETQSLGRYRPEALVAAPVRFPSCPQLGAFADCAIPRGAGIASGDTQGALAVIRDALAFVDDILQCAVDGPDAGRGCTSGGGVNLADIDTSGLVPGTADGIVDGVVLVSNALFPGIALPVGELATNPLLQFAGPFPSFTYGDVSVGAVAIAGAAAPPQRSTWVSVHEFGHLLGFADLYNERQTTTDMPYTLMGGWSYDSEGALLDAFSRVAIGWGHVVQAAAPGTFTLDPADTHGTVLKLGTGDEFFLVELRRAVPGATDGDLTVDHGVVVERVRLQKRPAPQRGSYLGTLAECVNCTAYDTFLSIEQADGRFDLEAGRPRDDADDLFFANDSIGPSTNTAPRTRDNEVFSTNRLDGAPTGITLRVLETSRDRAVIEVDVAAVADPCAEIAEWCAGLSCAPVDAGAECGRVDDGGGPEGSTDGDEEAGPPGGAGREDGDGAAQGCNAGDAGRSLWGALLALGATAWARRRSPTAPGRASPSR